MTKGVNRDKIRELVNGLSDDDDTPEEYIDHVILPKSHGVWCPCCDYDYVIIYLFSQGGIFKYCKGELRVFSREWIMRGNVLLETIAREPLDEYFINTIYESSSINDILAYPNIDHVRRNNESLDIAITVYLENQEIAISIAESIACDDDTTFREKNYHYYFGRG